MLSSLNLILRNRYFIMHFIGSIIHPVENLHAASDFLCKTLGFSEKDVSEEDCLLENGAVTLRLLKNTEPLITPLNLEMQTKQLEQDTQALLSNTEISLIAENISISPYRLETRLQAPHQLIITLFKRFDEDDLGIIPPLPISLDWDEATMACIQQLLKQVPIDFRELARKHVTERAETLAAEQGQITVEETHALNALADISPPFQQEPLIIALRKYGIDPELYFPSKAG